MPRHPQLVSIVAIILTALVCQSQVTDAQALKPTGPPIDPSLPAGISLPAGQPLARQFAIAKRPSLVEWNIVSGTLPTGLELSPQGMLHGTPTRPGTYNFTLTASDPTGPLTLPPTVINVTENIAITWKQPPHIEGDSIVGSVEIASYLSKPADLTLIVVAVNEINKAFALGYQQYTIAPNSRPQTIPFGAGTALPFGQYTIHADAVAEIPDTTTIYRSRLQTQTPLALAQR